MLRIILATFIILPLPAMVLGQENPVEIRHGTVLVYERTSYQVIVVVDSRILTKEKGKPNKACKIEAFSTDTAFFYSGNLFQGFETKSGKEVFSQQKVATEAYETFKTEFRSEQRLKNIANKYSKLARPKMDVVFKEMSREDSAKGWGLAGFVSLDELGQPRILQVNIPINVPNDGVSPVSTGSPSIGEPPLDGIMMSDPATPPYREVNEFLDAKTPRAKKAMDAFKVRATKLSALDMEAYKLIAAVEASLDWNKNVPAIGPPVNALVIEPSTGIRWIQGGERCGGSPDSQPRK